MKTSTNIKPAWFSFPPHTKSAWETLNPLENDLGVGLVELLVSLLIFAGVAAAIMVSYSNMPITSARGNVESTLQQDATMAIEQMAMDVRDTASADLLVTEDPNVQASTDADTLRTTAGTYTLATVNNVRVLRKGTETLLGDYRFDDYSMRVVNLNFVDNKPTSGINTISISFQADLLNTRYNRSLGTNETVVMGSFSYNTQAYPRNRGIP